MMILKNRKMQKFISSILVFAVFAPSLILFAKPQQAEAQNTDPVTAPASVFSDILEFLGNTFADIGAESQITDTGVSLKNLATTILQEVLRAVARKALQEITKSTVNWINNGFHGSPLFVETPGSFFQDIAKT